MICICENTPKYLFLPDCSFKICEKPSKFSKSVRVVIDDVNTKEFTIPFLPVHMGTRSNLLSKNNGQKYVLL